VASILAGGISHPAFVENRVNHTVNYCRVTQFPWRLTVSASSWWIQYFMKLRVNYGKCICPAGLPRISVSSLWYPLEIGDYHPDPDGCMGKRQQKLLGARDIKRCAVRRKPPLCGALANIIAVDMTAITLSFSPSGKHFHSHELC